MSILGQVYEQLYEAFGPQHWWPAESQLEVMVGAILTQNTSWKNVEHAIRQLKSAGPISLAQLTRLEQAELERLIRPAGYYRVKAKRIRNLVDFIIERFDGSLADMFAADLGHLRKQLLAVNGIGPETADVILLYAGALPTFVADTYAARLVKRHGWIDLDAGYDEVKQLFEAQLPANHAQYNEYHALIVALGKAHCRAAPLCEECPLRNHLPATGPIGYR